MTTILNASSKEWRPGAVDNHTKDANESVAALQAASAHVTAATGSFVDAMEALNKASLLSKSSQERLEAQVINLQNGQALIKRERNLYAREVASLREKQRQHDSELAKAKSIQRGLEEDSKTLVVDLDLARCEKDEAIKEAAKLRQKQTCHDEELAKAKENHEKHVGKVKEKLAADNAREISDMKVKLAKEKDEFQRSLDVPKELRQEIQRLKVENKTLKTKADGNKSMSKENVDFKKRVAQLEESLQAASNDLRSCKTQLNKETTKSKLLESRNTTLEGSYSSVVGKVGEQDKEAAKQIAELQADLQTAESDRSHWRQLCIRSGFVSPRLERKIEELECKIEALEAQVRELEERRDAQAPLVDIGIRVRKRYLVRESEGTPAAPRVVQLGNDAAHKMNAEADTAIFRLGFWKWDRHGQKFESIYGADLNQYARDAAHWERYEIAQQRYANCLQAFDQELVEKSARAKLLHDWMFLNGMKDGKTNSHWAGIDPFLEEFEELAREAETIMLSKSDWREPHPNDWIFGSG